MFISKINTWYLFSLYVCTLILLPSHFAWAGNLASRSDTLSSSAPSVSSNHTIAFTLENAVPASGKLVITPQAGAFNIPASLDYSDIDIKINTTDKPLSSIAGAGSGSNLGVSVISGNSGSIIITLNDSDALASGSVVQIDIGTTAVFGMAGDIQITNPSSIGSYLLSVTTKNASNTAIDTGNIGLAINEQVGVGGQVNGGTVATPIISPNGGTFTSSTSATITTSTVGASIYYTTDGSTPTSSSNLYTSAITITTSLTLKAIATLTNYADSPVASAEFALSTNNGNGVVNIYAHPTSSSDCAARIGDLNCDNKVNLQDLSILMYYWNARTPGLKADINHDNIVNLIDFSILIYWWTD